jgi:signal transduction histidine kinase
MKLLKNSWAGLKHTRDLLNEGSDMSPKTGVWISRLSRGAIIAQLALYLGCELALTVMWLLKGATDKMWAMNAVVTCGGAISYLSWLLAIAIDKHVERALTMEQFLKWAGLTALLGLPVGHLILYLAEKVQPLSALPSLMSFFPELMVGGLIAFSYLRFTYVCQWHERLNSEALKRHSAEQGQALAEARLTLLQAQIEPHFLYNTLASVQHLVRKDPENADFLLSQLISYMRQAIPDVRGTASALGREFGLIETYLNIVRVRMGGRLEVDVQCDPALADVPFPSLIIHTLVENAIQHGVERKPGPVSIAVRAARVAHDGQARIDITVQDNGPGFGAGDTVGTGVGLVNIRDRLVVAYQGRARLDITDAPGGGVRATVSIPGSAP